MDLAASVSGCRTARGKRGGACFFLALSFGFPKQGTGPAGPRHRSPTRGDIGPIRVDKGGMLAVTDRQIGNLITYSSYPEPSQKIAFP
ncbi:uncharacterized protein BO66DRAFT_22805 [Aspergillus aculeatinus CBS 121060]|uniref:Uncharacterized protein n=1 Tax=Aspergillus aculeatinus CBS 121060 TaxID=1448322 RepID=A0ACD1GR30_9EURO|nr:hypothetical protein BO66DRAFT_22805 [Aspergillus aculeatinus CBS 121060]RAH63781.1 hypothetical protein BO66DRAFT_22805 [Aspergillus aculeatinus CBS 121060]